MLTRLLPLLCAVSVLATEPPAFRLATFSVDVTPPVGHPCMGGGIAPVREVADPLFAKGLVLTGGDRPWVLVSFDWCEIRGTSFDQWRRGLAEAADTLPERVMVHSTHVHDAPVMDADAEKLLRVTEATGAWKDLPAPPAEAPVQVASVCWPEFNEACIRRVADAVRAALPKARRVTHLGLGKAEVEAVASNRRFLRADGTVSYARGSRSADAEARAAPAGEVDPWLRTLSFWEGDQPLCALHGFAVHPMSRYGEGRVSADFPGLARARMQAEHPNVAQIYVSGCAGNVTAGKWNDGGPDGREVLAGRLHDAMRRAWAQTRRVPLTMATFRQASLALGARRTPGHTETILRGRLANEARPFGRSEAAMGLAWYERVRAGHRVDLPCLDFGAAQVLLLPAEAYVEYQLFAQACRPESFVFVMGYGECGPGYIPVERAWREKDSNLHGWTWVPPGSEAVMHEAIRAVLTPGSAPARESSPAPSSR